MASSGTWRAVRWPVLAVLIAAGLVAVAFVLDTGSAAARDAALIIGAPALWLLLPAAALWLRIVLVRARRSRSGARKRLWPGEQRRRRPSCSCCWWSARSSDARPASRPQPRRRPRLRFRVAPWPEPSGTTCCRRARASAVRRRSSPTDDRHRDRAGLAARPVPTDRLPHRRPTGPIPHRRPDRAGGSRRPPARRIPVGADRDRGARGLPARADRLRQRQRPGEGHHLEVGRRRRSGARRGRLPGRQHLRRRAELLAARRSDRRDEGGSMVFSSSPAGSRRAPRSTGGARAAQQVAQEFLDSL